MVLLVCDQMINDQCALRMNRCKDCVSESNCIFVWTHGALGLIWNSELKFLPRHNHKIQMQHRQSERMRKVYTNWNRNQNKSTYRQPNVARAHWKQSNGDVCALNVYFCLFLSSTNFNENPQFELYIGVVCLLNNSINQRLNIHWYQ